ncbi:MAG: serine--tRNA ligase [Chloroflexi bacterium]|nr:serine--tRNA ligase [Chloroflexota bacterium]
MISIELIRREPDVLREAGRKRGEDIPVDRILELDERRRSAIVEGDLLRATRNEVSKQLGQMKERPPELIQEMRDVGAKVKTLEDEVRSVEDEINSLLLSIPNIPRDSVPLGDDESGNVVVRTVGEPQSYSFEPLPHWELGERLGIIDFQRGVKIAGSRFFVLKGKGSRLQRALIYWMIDLHTNEHGYDELYLPYMVNTASAIGSGQLPKFADTMYHDDEDDLWLIPTAEVPITNLYRDEILPHGTVPMHYVAHTPSFRRERAAAGRDTRGIKRVHQFEKVEMFKFVEPENSDDELEKLVSDAEDVCSRLGIPYRVIELCTGDLGFNAVKTYDIEMWAPGCNEWLEVSSCSNCADFQARRASIRYRPESGARPRFLHTLNGSGLALPRTIIAILENFQQADGSVIIPEVLRPYTGFDVIENPSSG